VLGKPSTTSGAARGVGSARLTPGVKTKRKSSSTCIGWRWRGEYYVKCSPGPAGRPAASAPFDGERTDGDRYHAAGPEANPRAAAAHRPRRHPRRPAAASLLRRFGCGLLGGAVDRGGGVRVRRFAREVTDAWGRRHGRLADATPASRAPSRRNTGGGRLAARGQSARVGPPHK
jgi:hypothetical protein